MNRVPVSIRSVAGLLLARCLFRCCRVRVGESTVTGSGQNPESLTAIPRTGATSSDTLDRDATVMALKAFWTADLADCLAAPRLAEATAHVAGRETQ